MENAYTEVGRLLKAHGLKGELKIATQENFEADLLESEVVFVGPVSAPIPYYIEHVKAGNPILIKLEGVDDRDQATALNGQPISLETKKLHQLPAQTVENPFEAWVGLDLIDQETGKVGPIKEVREFPFQWMAVVEHDGQERLIPLHEQLILRIDTDHQQLWMRLPEGLLEL